jgi:hypothetical protein
MKIQILLTWIATSLLLPQLATAQLPPVVDGTPSHPPATGVAPIDTSTSPTAAASGIKVSCQDLKTIVQKGDRQAVMVTWNSGYFGKEFTPEKRCQMVSARLQQAADTNGGTFKGLQLASGTVNSHPVICALQSGSTKCDRQNLLFTLKPENARNPEAIIQKIFKFAEDGSGVINESSSQSPKVDLDLGNWERQAFGQSKPGSANARSVDTGF